MKLFKLLVMVVIVYLPAVYASGEDSAADPVQSGRLYQPAENPMVEVDAALSRALANERLLLVVVGANWCHDSRALASRLYKQPLKTLVEKHYETVFVSVGYYEYGRDVVRRFGTPIYYATPTVLIVDPETGQLLNAENRHQWSNAFNIGMDESVEYFRQMAEWGPSDSVPTHAAELDRLKADIDAMEWRLAQRVDEAYAVLGPILKAWDQDEDPEGFDALWNEVADFRLAIPEDMQTLRTEARQRVSAGETNIQLEYPEYPPFSWQ